MSDAPVKPGDLIEYDVSWNRILVGIVLEHEDDIKEKNLELERLSKSRWRSDHPLQGPGVLIYWITNEIFAYWPYKDLQDYLCNDTMRIVATPGENDGPK